MIESESIFIRDISLLCGTWSTCYHVATEGYNLPFLDSNNWDPRPGRVIGFRSCGFSYKPHDMACKATSKAWLFVIVLFSFFWADRRCTLGRGFWTTKNGKEPPTNAAKIESDPLVCHVLYIQPGRLTWKLKITQLKRKFIFPTCSFGFHVDFPGCIWYWSTPRVFVCLLLMFVDKMTNDQIIATTSF